MKIQPQSKSAENFINGEDFVGRRTPAANPLVIPAATCNMQHAPQQHLGHIRRRLPSEPG